MAFDYSKLKGRIVEKYGTRTAFAEALGISIVALSHKINNITTFTPSEILKSCDLLDINKSEIADYFFNQNVQK